MRYLKQSTTVTVQVGPFLDDTDFKTAETALSPTIEISKAGAAYAARNSATAISHDADGWYRVELNTTDTGTVGPLMLKSTETGALHVWHEFNILPANAYDSLVAGTDLFDVSVTQWLGTAAATPTVAGVPEVDVTHWIGTAAATPTVAGVPEVDVTHHGGTAGIFSGGRPAVLSGYDRQSVYLNTSIGVAGTTLYVNGTVTNPVSTLADALTILAAHTPDLNGIHLANGDTITLAAARNDTVFWTDDAEGVYWTLEPNGQTMNGNTFLFAYLTKDAADDGFNTWYKCYFFDDTGNPNGQKLPGTEYYECAFYSSQFDLARLNSGQTFLMIDCFGFNDGGVSFYFVANCGLSIANWKGGQITLKNMAAGNTATISVADGSPIVIDSSCANATVTVSGFTTLTNNGSGMTVVQTANVANQFLKPTTLGHTLDVTATGAAGIDWGNVENPTTTVGLSGTTVKTATDVETDTADIQGRLPAALVGGRIDANVGAISSDATAADNAEAFFDGTGYAGTGNTIPTVTTVTNQVTANVTALSGDSVAADNAEAFFDGTGYAGTGNVIPTVTTVTTVNGLAAGAITAAAVATGAIDADAIAADAANEIADALLDRSSAVDGLTPRQVMRLGLSADTGKLSGAATTTVVIRDRADTKDRITATVDSDGNRTAVTVDAT